jgi:pimeloyl-ACP methyl ester carboxylesterase
MEQSLTFYDSDGHLTSAILARPDAPTDRLVVLCHGFLSNKNSTTNKMLARLLIERGIATFRFDFFGQGESQGPFEQMTLTAAIDQARSALDLVTTKGYRHLGLIGSSFGGLVSILVAAQRPDLSALALKCPVADFPETLRLEFGEERMAHWKQSDEIPNVTGGPGPVPLKYHLYENCLTYDAYKAAEAIQAPTLIVQGDCDELVPLHQSRRLNDAIRVQTRLEIVKGADHGFTNGDDFRRMTTLIADWMRMHVV